jgi:glycosyltransferase involved in cell wall biosynthesis
MQRPIRILFLIPTLAYGGAEMDLARLVANLDRNEFDITVYPYLGLGPLAHDIERAQARIVQPARVAASLMAGLTASELRGALARLTSHAELAGDAQALQWLTSASNVVESQLEASECTSRRRTVTKTVRGLARAALFMRRQIQQLRTGDFDIIHAILPYSYALGGALKASRMPRARLIMTRAGLNCYQHESPFYRVIERGLLHRVVSVAIGNSRAAIKELAAEGVRASKLMVIHNGIDIDAWHARMPDKGSARARFDISQSALVISNVANLWGYKGHDDLLRAASQWQSSIREPWVLMIAGRDMNGRCAELRALAANLGIGANVRFLGAISDVPCLMEAADIHVSASRTESLPNNVLEAMCSGLPVVATRVGGTDELVTPDDNGYLLHSGDWAGIAAAVSTLAREPDKREAMGIAGARRASRDFTIAQNASKHAEVYREVGRRAD